MFGMPREAIALGATANVLSPDEIAALIRAHATADLPDVAGS